MTAADPAPSEPAAARAPGPRALTKLAEPIHAVTYYTRELTDLTDVGYRGWWHAYFAYRPAPMGAVSAGTVTAAFYNFAPRMVERAVPGVWAIRSPADTVALRHERVAQALARIFGPPGAGSRPPEAAAAARLLRRTLDGLSVAGRPVFGAYAELVWPADDLEAVWHGCTLLRELRGDCHAIALAAAEIDGVMAHVLMAGRGHGNRPTIQAIRGWNDQEWDGAVAHLHERGWAGRDGSLTDAGRQGREAIERHTDALAMGPVNRLGTGLGDLLAALEPVAAHLVASGEVSATWPPPHLHRAEGGR